jgi:aryl-alcohol dehydrogenase-like predicted oxidoreductase
MQPLTGTTDARHMREDLEAFDVDLSDADVEQIENIATA